MTRAGSERHTAALSGALGRPFGGALARKIALSRNRIGVGSGGNFSPLDKGGGGSEIAPLALDWRMTISSALAISMRARSHALTIQRPTDDDHVLSDYVVVFRRNL